MLNLPLDTGTVRGTKETPIPKQDENQHIHNQIHTYTATNTDNTTAGFDTSCYYIQRHYIDTWKGKNNKDTYEFAMTAHILTDNTASKATWDHLQCWCSCTQTNNTNSDMRVCCTTIFLLVYSTLLKTCGANPQYAFTDVPSDIASDCTEALLITYDDSTTDIACLNLYKESETGSCQFSGYLEYNPDTVPVCVTGSCPSDSDTSGLKVRFTQQAGTFIL